jgi:hypothetical protein
MLARNHALAERICAPGFCLDTFLQLQKWQQNRLAGSFSDLMARDACRPACEFFLAELYGGLDFLERDQDMEKVMHVMVRFLPHKTLLSLAGAFELQAISLEFDVEMAEIMDSSNISNLNVSAYSSVYRACGQRSKREDQILLIQRLGLDLARLVNKPLVTALVRLLRGPAHAAGFGKLQEFLESGLSAFRELKDPAFFIDTSYQREWSTMQKLFAGDKNPFLV